MHRKFIVAGAVLVALGFVSGIAAAQTYWYRNGRYYLPARNMKGALEEILTDMQGQIDALGGTNGVLAGVTRVTDPNTGQDTLRFSGMNIQIVNGTGSTIGTTTGTGNLIIGYNELGHPAGDDRDGSHMLVVGSQNNYTGSSFGGIVVGSRNETNGNFAVVSCGEDNTASGFGSTVSGGRQNTASNAYATVSGGQDNEANGISASVSGGAINVAIHDFSTVSGGISRSTGAAPGTGDGDWVAGTLFEDD